MCLWHIIRELWETDINQTNWLLSQQTRCETQKVTHFCWKESKLKSRSILTVISKQLQQSRIWELVITAINETQGQDNKNN